MWMFILQPRNPGNALEKFRLNYLLAPYTMYFFLTFPIHKLFGQKQEERRQCFYVPDNVYGVAVLKRTIVCSRLPCKQLLNGICSFAQTKSRGNVVS